MGRWKAQVLAERLARRFGREVGYSTRPYDGEVHAQVFRDTYGHLNLLIGAVDNAAARRAIAASLDGRPATPTWSAGYSAPSLHQGIRWLDCGNGRNSGQVLLGNATRPEWLRGSFLPALEPSTGRSSGTCRALPAPRLQRPDLLDAPPEARLVQDCAEAVASREQGPTINQVVAAIAAGYVEKLLTGTCGWMATYVEFDDGTLRCVPADPRTVAAIAGLHPNAVAPPSRGT